MELLTDEIREKMIANHLETDQKKKLFAEVKLFNPTGLGTWWLSELDPETNVAFGIAEIQEKEYGYVSIDELKEFKGSFGLPIERDLYFKPVPLDDLA
tara:strand:+ start:660 stop:953 length:294 start_codon:yes stop_codon:yes gene_type:complete